MQITMIQDDFFLAVNNVKRRGIRSGLTLLGIFLGVAAVVSLISLGSALQQAITGQFSTLDADKLVVENVGTGFGPPGSTVVKKLTAHDLRLIENTPEIDLVIKRYIRSVSVEFNDHRSFEIISSLPTTAAGLNLVYDFFNAEAQQGKLIDETAEGKVVLGNNFLDDDKFGKLIRVGKSVLINGKPFKVAGILKKSSSFILNDVILMPENDLINLLNLQDEIDLIVVQVTEAKQLESTAEILRHKFRRDRRQDLGEEDFSIQTPEQSLSAVNTILTIINIIVSSIAALSLVIGGIGIANTMYTSVLERTKEIGVMKSIGANSKKILFIFLVESGLLGLVGGIVGTVIGLSLAWLVTAVATRALGGFVFTIKVSWPLLFLAIAFSLIVGIVSGIIPAIQASRLHPVEALRK